MPQTLRVRALHVENFKGLARLDLKPGTNLIVVKGRNGAGKSSALDSIWWVLDSKHAGKAIKDPIRRGADKATVILDLGDVIAKKTKRRGKAAELTLKNKDGSKHKDGKRPAEVLSRMVDSVSLDPMEFSRASPKERLAMLMAVVELPFDPAALDEQQADWFAGRTDANRDLRRLEARRAAMPEVDEGAPEAVSVANLLEDYKEAERRQKKAEELRHNLQNANSAVDQAKTQAYDAKLALRAAEGRLEGMLNEWQEAKRIVGAIPANLVDPATIKARINSAEANNLAAHAAERNEKERAHLDAEIKEQRANSEALTTSMKSIDKQRADGMAAAKFPVKGLGFTADGVTFNGIPFEDCCTGEKWRCAIGIVMARDPQIHVLRVKDGALLDDEAMATLDEMCQEHDWDAWVEIRTNGDLEYPGVVIEEGEAK